MGAAAMLVAAGLKAAGIEIGEAEVNNLIQAGLSIVGFVGVVVGRFTAKQDLAIL